MTESKFSVCPSQTRSRDVRVFLPNHDHTVYIMKTIKMRVNEKIVQLRPNLMGI